MRLTRLEVLLQFVSTAILLSLVAPSKTYRVITGDTLIHEDYTYNISVARFLAQFVNLEGLNSLTTTRTLYHPEYDIAIQSGCKKSMHTR